MNVVYDTEKNGVFMGFNTTMIIMNDALHEIEQDKEFGKKVYDASISALRLGPTNIRSGMHSNAATIIETHHADLVKIIAIGGNYGQDLGFVGSWSDSPEDYLRRLADLLGFDIRKKRK